MGTDCLENEDKNKNKKELILFNNNTNSVSNDKLDYDSCNNFYCCFKENLCDISVTYFFPGYKNIDIIKLKEKKKTILKRQEKFRSKNNFLINDEHEKNSMINQVLEDTIFNLINQNIYNFSKIF